MTVDLILLAVIGLGVGFGIWQIVKIGKKSQLADEQEEVLDAVDDANEVRRDVDRDPDPNERLQDDWRR